MDLQIFNSKEKYFQYDKIIKISFPFEYEFELPSNI